MDLLALKQIQHTGGTIKAGAKFTASEAFAKMVIASGQAVVPGTRLQWDKLHWPNSTVVCIASGPSLTLEDCARVREWRAAAPDRYVITVNTTFKAAPWADIVFACDPIWWERSFRQVEHETTGQRWTIATLGEEFPKHIKQFGLNYVWLERFNGLNCKVGFVNGGSNGGYQAVGLAYHAGATKVILLGYDMSADGDTQHWHPEHHWHTATRPYRNWAAQFGQLYDDLRMVHVEIVNATRRSAILKIPKVPLEEALR